MAGVIKRVRRFVRNATQAEERHEALFEDAKHGEHCRLILDDEIFATFWARQEQQLVERMLRLDAGDDEGRYRLAVAIQAVRQVREYLQRSAEAGAVARAELDALEDGPAKGWF
jgi:hypothetical protein